MQVTGPAVPPVQKQTLEQSESTAQRSPAVRMGSISLNILFPEVNPDQQCLPTCFKKTKQMPKRHGFTWSGILAGFGLCSYVYIKALQASLLDASQCPTNSAQAKLPLLCLSRACLGCSNKPAFFHPSPTTIP